MFMQWQTIIRLSLAALRPHRLACGTHNRRQYVALPVLPTLIEIKANRRAPAFALQNTESHRRFLQS
jgi:hypothetical protein